MLCFISHSTRRRLRISSLNYYSIVSRLDRILFPCLSHTGILLLSRSNSYDYKTDIIYIMYKLYVEIHTNMHTDQRYVVCPIIRILPLSRSNKSVQLYYCIMHKAYKKTLNNSENIHKIHRYVVHQTTK